MVTVKALEEDPVPVESVVIDQNPYRLEPHGLGDINDDGIIDETDMTIIGAHLNEMQEMSEDQKTRADIDKDGNVLINDVTGIQQYVASFTKYPNVQINLSATVMPNDATNKNVIWTSSNDEVATVDEEGLVETKQPGTATITVTTEDGNKTATCVVTVKPLEEDPIPVESVEIEINPYGIEANGKGDVVKDGKIDDIDVQKIQNYLIEGNEITEEVIEVADIDGNGTISSNDATELQRYISFEMYKRKTINAGESVVLTARVNPKGATNKNVTWRSSNESIATVNNETGEVTGVGSGTVIITVTTEDGNKTATFEIIVE